MERKIHIVLFQLLLFISWPVCANDQLAIYNAYIKNDMQTWKKIIDRIQKQQSKTNELLLSLVNYQYGYVGWCIGMKYEKEANNYIIVIRQNLAVLEKNNYNLSMINAYRSALYGYEIGLNMIRAPFIGPKSLKCAEEALKIDPGNPFAYTQMGNIQYYMPSMFGGSVDKAIEYFLEAKKRMEKNREALRHDWNYLHLLTLIAQAYSNAGNYVNAKIYCDAILKIEPQFQWIKDELYPHVLQQIKK